MNDFTFYEFSQVIQALVRSPLTFTDIHIEEDSPIVIRTPKGWVPVSGQGGAAAGPFDYITPIREDITGLLDSIQSNWKAILESGGSVSEAIDLSENRLRCNAYCINGKKKISVSVRRLNRRPPDPETLGIPKQIVWQCTKNKGLFLVTGPTGAGKTTTIASLLNYINETRSTHIVTIEKPIEYEFERKKSVFSQKEVGKDVPSFAEGLEETLQQRPNIIMIGEVRDKKSVETMLHAAESGHLVFATMHSTSAEGVISKILSFFPGDERESHAITLANNLIAVIGQNLAATPDEQSFQLVSEVLMNSPMVAKAIATPGGLSRLKEIMRTSEDRVSKLMNNALADMIKTKTITQSEAIRVSYDPLSLSSLFGG